MDISIVSNRNVLSCKPTTNILRLHPSSRLVLDLTAKIGEETDEDKLLADDLNETLMAPVILTEVVNGDYSRLHFFKLNDLFLQYEQIPEDVRKKNVFKVRFYVLRVEPPELREMVQAMCPECKETFSCKDLGKDGKAKCKDCHKECQLIYRIQFLVKDSSSQMNKNFYRILLYSDTEEKGHNFFNGVKPCNLYKNEEALRSLEKQVKILGKFNVWVDAILERQNTFFMIRDTEIKMKLA